LYRHLCLVFRVREQCDEALCELVNVSSLEEINGQAFFLR